MSHRSGFNNRALFSTHKPRHVDHVLWEAIEVLECELSVIAIKIQGTSMHTVGMGTGKLEGLNFQHSFYNLVCTLRGCGCSSWCLGQCQDRNIFLNEFPGTFLTASQCLCSRTLHVLMLIIFHANVKCRCRSVAGVLLRSPSPRVQGHQQN